MFKLTLFKNDKFLLSLINKNIKILRTKSTTHWTNIRKTITPMDIALQHFDNFYSKVYDKKWNSIRLGLICYSKHCALINPFVNVEEVVDNLKRQGAIDLWSYYEKHYKWCQRYKMRLKILKEKKEKKRALLAEAKKVPLEDIHSDCIEVSDVSDSDLSSKASSLSEPENLLEMFETDIEAFKKSQILSFSSTPNINYDDFVPASEMKYQEQINTDINYYQFYETETVFPFEVEEEPKLELENFAKVFTFPRGIISQFEAPKCLKNSFFLNYYLLDASSILAVVTLNVKFKDIVGDFCAAPGGKSLAILFTMKPSSLMCNDSSKSRLEKLKRVFYSYIPPIKALDNVISYRNIPAELLLLPDAFDKILVDVPCTNDRVSASKTDNNIFKIGRFKERINLPQKQKKILVSALKCLKPKGSLIYSTCSLSPIQNDGVVHMSLKQVFEETGLTFTIRNLKETYRPLRGLFRFHEFKYGQQIVPFLPSNFGPMYISKIVRKK